jgi:hypothetical protein
MYVRAVGAMEDGRTRRPPSRLLKFAFLEAVSGFEEALDGIC